ncbi:peptidase inhibitor family I36 protein [Actinomadura oligospora]|uniref:peptidase inhibitor family I36 protein n=1 Tax=Actinomadura oligospora TaxID=111804 RepID=UPI00047D7515|nr:peptidase inhibitor family I36 protein [Actinomadura oligospora]
MLKHVTAVAATAIVTMSLAVGTADAHSKIKCNKGEICTWTKYDFKGSPGFSGAHKGVCYHGHPFRSMRNRSSKSVRVYFDMSCKGSYQTVKPGALVGKFHRGGNRWSYKVR